MFTNSVVTALWCSAVAGAVNALSKLADAKPSVYTDLYVTQIVTDPHMCVWIHVSNPGKVNIHDIQLVDSQGKHTTITQQLKPLDQFRVSNEITEYAPDNNLMICSVRPTRDPILINWDPCVDQLRQCSIHVKYSCLPFTWYIFTASFPLV